jgi:hypothetical protein
MKTALLIVALIVVTMRPASACETCVRNSVVAAACELSMVATHVPGDDNTFTRSKEASKAIPFKVIGALWVDPKVWKTSTEPVVEGADLELDHHTGNAKLFGMSMKEFAPLELVLNGFIEGARENGPDIKLVKRDDRVVNGAKVLCAEVQQTMGEIPVTMFVYFYTGAHGSIQLVSTVASEIFPELRGDIEKAMNGLVVK